MDDEPATARSRRRPAFSPAADAIGSELDLRLTGSHVVHALTPGFCDAASVYLLERWLLEENAYGSAEPPQIEARRLALRIGTDAPEDWEGLLPVGEVIVFPRGTPYTRAIATFKAQLLDTVDAHTSARRSTSGGGDARMDVLLRTASFLVVPLHLRGTAVGFIACTRGPDEAPPLQSLCRRLLHGTSATNDGADDRTLLLTELVPANHMRRGRYGHAV